MNNDLYALTFIKTHYDDNFNILKQKLVFHFKQRRKFLLSCHYYAIQHNENNFKERKSQQQLAALIKQIRKFNCKSDLISYMQICCKYIIFDDNVSKANNNTTYDEDLLNASNLLLSMSEPIVDNDNIISSDDDNLIIPYENFINDIKTDWKTVPSCEITEVNKNDPLYKELCVDITPLYNKIVSNNDNNSIIPIPLYKPSVFMVKDLEIKKTKMERKDGGCVDAGYGVFTKQKEYEQGDFITNIEGYLVEHVDCKYKENPGYLIHYENPSMMMQNEFIEDVGIFINGIHKNCVATQNAKFCFSEKTNLDCIRRRNQKKKLKEFNQVDDYVKIPIRATKKIGLDEQIIVDYGDSYWPTVENWVPCQKTQATLDRENRLLTRSQLKGNNVDSNNNNFSKNYKAMHESMKEIISDESITIKRMKKRMK